MKEKTISEFDNIKGRRIRENSFRGMLIYSIVIAAGMLGFLVEAIVHKMSFETIRLLLFMMVPCCLFLAVPLFTLAVKSKKKVICILADDSLYFLDSELAEWDAEDPKVKRATVGNGFVDYGAITEMKYIPQPRASILRASRLILKGQDFSLTLERVEPSLQRAIRKKQKALKDRAIILVPYKIFKTQMRGGRWNELWEFCQTREHLEDLFEGRARLTNLTLDEVSDFIDVIFERNGHEILILLEKDSVYVDIPDASCEKTIPMDEIADAKTLWKQIQDFVEQAWREESLGEEAQA